VKKFFSFIIKRSVAIILLIVFILAFGIYSTGNMAINLLPDIQVPMVCIQVIYPGASASSVEKDVTNELEDGLSAIAGVTNVDSYSYDNLSAVVLSFDYGTDTKEKKSDISTKLDGITLPDDCTTTVYDIDLNSQALAVLSVTGENGLDDTYAQANKLKTSLAAIEGVESVEVLGGGDNVIKITPFVGTELISLLLVQSLSYGALDIPLGNLKVDGSDVQIRNNSDIASVDDILNSPVSIPSSFVTLLASVKQVMDYYEESTQDDLITLRTDLGNGVVAVLGQIDEMSSDELNDFAELKTYMNIAATYTAETLTNFKTSRYYSEIYKQVDGKTDDELVDLADDINEQYPNLPFTVSADLLKVIRENKIDSIITYRNWLEEQQPYLDSVDAQEYYELTLDDYYVLAVKQNLTVNGEETEVGMGVYDVTDPEEEVKQDIDFALKTSATGLATIADKKKDVEDENAQNGTNNIYNPTNKECALLFTGTDLSSEHPIVMSSTFMAFVRSDHYEDNMQKLIDRRGELGVEISAEEFYALYNELYLDDVLEVTLSVELINFIRTYDLGDLTTTSDGSQALICKIGDIATVEKTAEYSSYAYYYGGEMNIVNGVIINIYKSNGANSSAVVKNVKKVYGDMTANGTITASINLLDDQSEFISDSISNVLVSMIIGGVLAIIIIFIFLKKVKPSIIISVTMPLSVLSALICMYAMGITLNMVSLGGLAVGIGMLVDNSIVVIEAITKHYDSGKTAYEAAVDGTCEVGGALIGSTLTTVCVFIPIIFSGGLTGEIFTDLSWAVIFSLTFSLLIAVSVIPTLYSLLNGGDKHMLKASQTATTLNESDWMVVEEDNKESAQIENNSSTLALSQNAEKSQPLQISEQAEQTPQKETSKEECNKLQVRGKVQLAEKRVGDLPAEVENTATVDKNQPAKGKGGKVKNFFKMFTTSFIMDGIKDFYKKILPAVLKKKVVCVVAALVIFGTSVFLVTLTGTEFLPSIDKGQIEVKMSYGATAQLDNVKSDVDDFMITIRDNVDNIDYMSASVGKNGLLALTNTGIITVQLTTSRHTDDVVEQIRGLAEDKGISDNVVVRQIDGVVASLFSGSSDLSMSLSGEDSQKLATLSNEICSKLKSEGFTGITDTLTEKSKQYRMVFDEYQIAKYGLDYTTLITTLRVGIAGYTASTVEIEGQTYSVNVQFDESVFKDESDNSSLQKLANFIVGYDGSDAIHLKDILKVEEGTEDTFGIIVEETDACIRRSNGLNTVTITAQLSGTDTGTASDKMKAIASDVLNGGDYEGYSFQSSGVSSYLSDAFQGLAVALVISFFLLYAVMAIQFSSFIKPIIVMASIPFCFTGGFFALVITGTSLNVVSFIGLIMLMGVVVNNAIVMLEKINQLHLEGMPHYNAVQAACVERLRPILMTTLTTILALVPMAIGVGKGSELMQPLGIVVMGGLLLGTLVTLVLVPAVYCIFNRLSEKYPEGKRAAKKSQND
jgi:HAE1 family hydrophobic/amphiphilic exporter-1